MEVQHLGATEFKSTRFFVPVTRLKLCPSEYSHRISWFLPSRRPDQNAEVQPDVNLTRTDQNAEEQPDVNPTQLH